MSAPDLPPSFASRHARLLGTLGTIHDPQQRLAWVVDQARHRPPFPADWRVPEALVPGCAARLWFRASQDHPAGPCRFALDSDSAILKAAAGLLCDLYDGLSCEEVLAHEPDFLRATGVLQQLTENRQRTLLRVRDVIRAFAASRGSGHDNATDASPIGPA